MAELLANKGFEVQDPEGDDFESRGSEIRKEVVDGVV